MTLGSTQPPAGDSASASKDLLLDIVDNMSDGLLLLDSDRRISYVNRRAADLLQIDHSALVGKRDAEAFAAAAHLYENGRETWAAWENALSHLDERPCFDLRVAGGGLHTDLQVRFFRVPGGPDAADGTGLTIQDVSTERRLVRAKDEFVAAVSHELASPATNLVSYAELLSSQVYPAVERQEMLETMVQEGRRLMAIIRDFVDVQRGRQGQLTVHARPTDLQSLLKHVVNIARTDTAHRLVVAIPDCLPLVQADPERVQQVLANLVSNAQKYTPAGRSIHLSARVSASSVEVAVTDQGLGIPADALPRVFEKFYRVDADDRRTIKGTGLGLAIVKDLVEAQGGEVGVSSKGLGAGACFWFRLPLAASNLVDLAPPAPAAAARTGFGAERLRVLCVDDDRAIGAALVRVLRPDGHQVVAVRSGEDALRRLADESFDVIISDLGLGSGMDGWELVRRVRAEWPRVHFVLASGSVGVNPLAARQLGVDAVLAKPFLPDDLRRVLHGLAQPRAGAAAA